MNANLLPEPADQDVQEEAYLLYTASGCAPGRDLENWLAARARLMARGVSGGTKGAISAAFPKLHFPLNANLSRSPFTADVPISIHN